MKILTVAQLGVLSLQCKLSTFNEDSQSESATIKIIHDPLVCLSLSINLWHGVLPLQWR